MAALSTHECERLLAVRRPYAACYIPLFRFGYSPSDFLYRAL
ncbi:hypothetical protein AtDm6_3687 [Acetobacter tropicalis]|uniref:Uncharacterized protein n=1 Tax=Acetobacter tropicalis TaxID=104102 RepID=A0A094YF79_9PROT|nr:hypothetical protein AtDm6_3687 [Acetobacter tropicalis]